jgi:hypothetical protein
MHVAFNLQIELMRASDAKYIKRPTPLHVSLVTRHANDPSNKRKTLKALLMQLKIMIAPKVMTHNVERTPYSRPLLHAIDHRSFAVFAEPFKSAFKLDQANNTIEKNAYTNGVIKLNSSCKSCRLLLLLMNCKIKHKLGFKTYLVF